MSDPIQALVSQLARLPGVGPRTATRLVHHLLRTDRELMRALARSLEEVADRVHECPRCALLTAHEGACAVCRDPARDPAVLAVVATIQDQAAIESTGAFKGRYHVLHGTLAPLSGIGPDDLRVKGLLERLMGEDRDVAEILLATPPTVDGEATALYLARQLAGTGLALSRIASGVPVGGDLQFADRLTLARAITLRRAL